MKGDGKNYQNKIRYQNIFKCSDNISKVRYELSLNTF